ncbi:hypothetical protein ACQ859_22175 [Roseateles chitinivorans]|uniref:hypothetical protein n=1 Tax=Roseateles chitinivorans TaxID=2917965 RepID=UPI003D6660B2
MTLLPLYPRRLSTRAALCAVLGLAACGTPPVPYVVPKEAPVAQIRTALELPSSHASVTIRVGTDPSSPFHPFFTGYGYQDPTPYRDLAASQYFAVYYSESLPAGERCEIRTAFVLEPGKRYTLRGGAHFEPSFLGRQIRSCRLRLQDDGTGQEVPMLKRE